MPSSTDVTAMLGAARGVLTQKDPQDVKGT